MSGLADLREALTGEVLEPGEPGYEAARKPAIAQFWRVRPQAVIRCASVEDVVRTLGFARESGVHVVPRGGGHCFAGRSSTDGIVLDMTPLRSISLSPAGMATIGAGARLADVYDALHEHGLTLPAGCGPSVGITGLTLGGGLGILGRRYGLTCDRLLGAQVVLTDGRVVDCDANHDPELFWALRGAGGGQFGVVTSLAFDPVPEPDTTRFALAWSSADAPAVIAAWQDWAPNAPDDLSANLKLVAADGPVQVIMFGAMLGTQADTAAQIAHVVGRVGTHPQSETWAGLPYSELKRSLLGIGSAGEAEEPGRIVSRSEFFRQSLPATAVSELLDVFTRDRSPGERRELNFTPLGGAYNRVLADDTAFVHRSERFLLEHAAVHRESGKHAATQWARRSWAVVHPWGSGRVYQNFPDPDVTNWTEAYHGSNYARLARAKRVYDPDRLLHFRQAI
jgi:FAD/FMN-containing dehydrogenase